MVSFTSTILTFLCIILQIYTIVFFFSASCPPLTAPDNGDIDCSGLFFEDTCTFSCNDGYELTGSENRTCQSDQTWSGTETTCTRGTVHAVIVFFLTVRWCKKTGSAVNCF